MAVLLTLAVAGVYFYRAQQARRAGRDAPAVVPPTVEQRAAEFSFSKVEGDRTLFTVRASRATDFAEGGSLLEDVWITIYGRRGDRFDNLHARECNYYPAQGQVTCAGEVRIEIDSGHEAHPEHPAGEMPAPSPGAIQVTTSNLSFENETGILRTGQRVTFRFPRGQGSGTGIRYRTREGLVRLERDVEIHARGDEGPVRLRAESLEYRADARQLRLLGGVRAEQGARTLTASTLTLVLDEQMRARQLVAGGRPRVESREPRGRSSFTGDELSAQLSGAGQVERVRAQGNAAAHWTGAAGEDRLAAEQLELELGPAGAPERLRAQGSVRGSSQRSGEARALETASLEVLFRNGQPQQAGTLAPGTVEWRRGQESLRVSGQRLAAEFGERGGLVRLTGRDGVELTRRLPGRPEQASRSRELAVSFGAGGGWTEITQSGAVRIREAGRSAEADGARFVQAGDTLTLAGRAVVSDAETRTAAETITFHQRTGEVRAEGNVRTSYLAAGGGGIANFAAEPAHLAAARLAVDTGSGRAVYSGGARLWQGQAVIEAGTIELDRGEGALTAREGVTALFPQARADARPAAQRVVWRVASRRLTYRGRTGVAEFAENVSAESSLGRIRSERLELELGEAGGQRELARAVATGGVNVRQGQRRATAERAEYFAAEGKFVLSGGTPIIQDASRGTVSGQKLTFTIAGDKILVESEEGSRTLTRHRVQE